MKSRSFAAAALLSAVVAVLLVQPQSPQAVTAPTVSVDTEITGNSAITVGAVDACQGVASSAGPFSVDIVIQGVTSLSLFEADLLYNGAVLTVIDPVLSEFILATPPFPPPLVFDLSDTPPDNDGVFHISIASSGNGSGNGVIVRLTLQPNGGGTSHLKLDRVSMQDFNESPLLPLDGQGFYAGTVNEGRIVVDGACVPDADGDGVSDAGDNCPYWRNPSQNLPPWPLAASDPDCDGFSTANETTIGVRPTRACGGVAWSPDFDDSREVDISDVLFMKPVFGGSVPPISPRYDIVPSGLIDVSDVLALKPFFGAICA
jgi:hypothetical protein